MTCCYEDKSGVLALAHHLLKLYNTKKQAHNFHWKKLLLQLWMYQYFIDKICTTSNLLLGPTIKIPSTSSYIKLLCFKHYIHFPCFAINNYYKYIHLNICHHCFCFKLVKATGWTTIRLNFNRNIKKHDAHQV